LLLNLLGWDLILLSGLGLVIFKAELSVLGRLGHSIIHGRSILLDNCLLIWTNACIVSCINGCSPLSRARMSSLSASLVCTTGLFKLIDVRLQI